MRKLLASSRSTVTVVAKCTERACPWPRMEGSPYCHQHQVMRTEPQRFEGISTLAMAQEAWLGILTDKE